MCFESKIQHNTIQSLFIVLVSFLPYHSFTLQFFALYSFPVFIKLCLELFSHFIARLAPSSFSIGVFRSVYKTASVTPLLKKANLDWNNPAKIRPISNLHIISKILERLFLTRIIQHIQLSPNFNHYQYAYRRGYSTETSLTHKCCI